MHSTALTTPLKRTAIFVKDIVASSSFYEELFGYELWKEGVRTGEDGDPAVFLLVGLSPGRCRFRVVRANRTDYGMIGFFQYDDRTVTELTKVRGRVNIGETCLVFITRDMDEICRRLDILQADIICPPPC